jgi:ABC-type sugar transport system permease subunit
MAIDVQLPTRRSSTRPPGAPPSAPSTPRRRRGGGTTGMAWGLLIPSLVIVGVVSIFPIVYAVNLSVHATMYLNIGRFTGIGNYLKLFVHAEGWMQILHSFLYVLVSLAIVIPLSLGLAHLLNQPVRGRAVFRVIILLPWVISQTVAALVWKWLVNPDYGPLGLGDVGGHKLDLLSSPLGAMAVLILVNVWISYPLATILNLAALQTIPAELREAAEVDGAGAFRRFLRVTLPLMRPTLMVVAIMLTLLYFNMVTLVYTLTGGGPLDGTNVLSLEAFKQSFQFFNVGVGAAYSVVLFVFNVVFGAAYIRLLRSDAA